MAVAFNVLIRNFSSSSSLNNAIKHVTVVGGGLMGSGIAQVLKIVLRLQRSLAGYNEMTQFQSHLFR